MQYKINPSRPINGIRYCSARCDQYNYCETHRCMIDDGSKRIIEDFNECHVGLVDICPYWVMEVSNEAEIPVNFKAYYNYAMEIEVESSDD